MMCLLRTVVLGASLTCVFVASVSLVQADDAADKPVPSKHQLMKECMAKQQASDGGMPKEEMKQNCRDVTATQHENDEAEKQTEESAETPKK